LDRIHATITNHNDDYIPQHTFTAGDWEGFMQTVSTIASSPTKSPAPSNFRFDFSLAAAEHNSKILASANFHLGKAIDDHNKFTTLTMGSELRPIQQLDQLLSHHPNYPLF
jgi:hypothetical protein